MTAAIFSASIATGRPPRRPRRRAAARPALTRSRVSDRSNCASAPKIWKSNSPCGVVVSICSVSERNATPRSFSPFTVANRWGSDRPRRSSFHTTRQSPGFRNASAFARPPRRRGCRWRDLRTDAARQLPLPAGRRAAKSRTWRSPSVETRMYPTIMCGNPRLTGFRTLRHSDGVCRRGFKTESGRWTRSAAACRKSPVFRQPFSRPYRVGYSRCGWIRDLRRTPMDGRVAPIPDARRSGVSLRNSTDSGPSSRRAHGERCAMSGH